MSNIIPTLDINRLNPPILHLLSASKRAQTAQRVKPMFAPTRHLGRPSAMDIHQQQGHMARTVRRSLQTSEEAAAWRC